MGKTNPKAVARQRRKKRFIKKIRGTPDRPRLCVFRSNKHIFAQIIDDENSTTLVSASTLSKEIAGSVDKKTQRAAWTVGDNKTTVYETGIYNLTKEQTPILVHFGPDRTEQWLLVRMKQQDNSTTPQAGATPGN